MQRDMRGTKSDDGRLKYLKNSPLDLLAVMTNAEIDCTLSRIGKFKINWNMIYIRFSRFWIPKEWLWDLGSEQLQWQQYDSRMKCAQWSFQKIQTNHSVRSLLSSRDTKEIWSNIWNTERDTLNGVRLEDLRKRLFDRKWSFNFFKYINLDFWCFQVLAFLAPTSGHN